MIHLIFCLLGILYYVPANATMKAKGTCSLWIIPEVTSKPLEASPYKCLAAAKYCKRYYDTCSLTFYSKSHFVTAAHCFNAFKEGFRATISCESEGLEFEIHKNDLRIHPDYHPDQENFDLALGRVNGEVRNYYPLGANSQGWLRKRDFDFGLGSSEQVVFSAQNKCISAGYGLDDQNRHGYYHENLVEHYDVVDDWALQIFDNALTFTNTFNQGDSGGPILCEREAKTYIVGVNSYVFNDNVEAFAGIEISLFIPNYLDWIKRQTWSPVD